METAADCVVRQLQVQHLFVTLGGRASGRGRTVLADLRRGYETKHKYEGKV